MARHAHEFQCDGMSKDRKPQMEAEADLWKRSNITWHTQRRHETAGEKKEGGLYIANGAAAGIVTAPLQAVG